MRRKDKRTKGRENDMFAGHLGVLPIRLHGVLEKGNDVMGKQAWSCDSTGTSVCCFGLMASWPLGIHTWCGALRPGSRRKWQESAVIKAQALESDKP